MAHEAPLDRFVKLLILGAKASLLLPVVELRAQRTLCRLLGQRPVVMRCSDGEDEEGRLVHSLPTAT